MVARRRFRIAVALLLGVSGCAGIIGLEPPSGEASRDDDGFADAPGSNDAGDSTFDAGSTLPFPDADTAFLSKVDPDWLDGSPLAAGPVASMDLFDELDASVLYVAGGKSAVTTIVQLGKNGREIGTFKHLVPQPATGVNNETMELIVSLQDGAGGVDVAGIAEIDAGNGAGAKVGFWLHRFVLGNADAGGVVAGPEYDASPQAIDVFRGFSGISFALFANDAGQTIFESTAGPIVFPGTPLAVYPKQDSLAANEPLVTTLVRTSEREFQLDFINQSFQSYEVAPDTTDASAQIRQLTSLALSRGAFKPWLVGTTASGDVVVGSITASVATVTPVLRAPNVSILSAASTADNVTVAGGCISRDGVNHPWLATFNGTTYVEGSAIAATDLDHYCVQLVRRSPSGRVVVLLREAPPDTGRDAGTDGGAMIAPLRPTN